MNLSDDLLEVYVLLISMRDEFALRGDYYSLDCIKNALKELAKVRIRIYDKKWTTKIT